MAVPRILIVDDDAAVRGLLRVVTERCGIEAHGTASGIECLDLLSRIAYDLVIIDLSMPSVNGSDLFEYLRRKAMRPTVIVLTALTRWSFIDIDPSIVQCILRKPLDLNLATAVISSTASAMHERRAAMRASPHDEERRAL